MDTNKRQSKFCGRIRVYLLSRPLFFDVGHLLTIQEPHHGSDRVNQQ